MQLAATLCLALFVPVAALAQVMNDPTRPPEGLAVSAADADEAGGAGGVMLQSVMISPTQKTAIISGVLVKLGEKYGDAVLVRVSESEVVLKSGGVQQVLKLYPGVNKRVIAPIAEKGARGPGNARAGAAQPR